MKSAMLINILAKHEDIAISTASEFFRRHNMPQLEERVRFGYAADFGATRPLTNILVRIFDLNSRKFIRFYEGIFRRRAAPHYEDALAVVTLILVAIGIFLSPIIGVEYANLRKRMEKDGQSISAKDYREILDLFKYLIKVFALREAYYERRISKKEFVTFKKATEQLTLKQAPNEYSEDTLNRIERIWGDFDSTANFHFDEQLLDELKMLAEDKKSEIHVEHPKLKKRQKDRFITLKGWGVSPGQAQGPIKAINSHEDLEKINEGDIAVFRYFNPEMVPALKNSVASIGLPGCGGRTGHLAIVCRELEIPCVVRLENVPYEDGTRAVVSGSTGKIKIAV